MYALRYLNPPIKDYIEFKKFESGNEIIVNLENITNLSMSELMGGMMELTRRTQQEKLDVNWNDHPIIRRCLWKLKMEQSRMSAKHIAQTQLILEGLKVTDKIFWRWNAKNTLRLLHKYNARDMAQFMDIFDKEVLDEEGEAIFSRKAG